MGKGAGVVVAGNRELTDKTLGKALGGLRLVKRVADVVPYHSVHGH